MPLDLFSVMSSSKAKPEEFFVVFVGAQTDNGVVARGLQGAVPPVDFRAVCLVRTISTLLASQQLFTELNVGFYFLKQSLNLASLK